MSRGGFFPGGHGRPRTNPSNNNNYDDRQSSSGQRSMPAYDDRQNRSNPSQFEDRQPRAYEDRRAAPAYDDRRSNPSFDDRRSNTAYDDRQPRSAPVIYEDRQQARSVPAYDDRRAPPATYDDRRAVPIYNQQQSITRTLPAPVYDDHPVRFVEAPISSHHHHQPIHQQPIQQMIAPPGYSVLPSPYPLAPLVAPASFVEDRGDRVVSDRIDRGVDRVVDRMDSRGSPHRPMRPGKDERDRNRERQRGTKEPRNSYDDRRPRGAVDSPDISNRERRRRVERDQREARDARNNMGRGGVGMVRGRDRPRGGVGTSISNTNISNNNNSYNNNQGGNNRRPTEITPDLPPITKAASDDIILTSKPAKGATGADFHVSPIHVAHSLIVGNFCVHTKEYADHLTNMMATGSVIQEVIEDDTPTGDERRFVVMTPSPSIWNSFWERLSILANEFASDISKMLQYEHHFRYSAKSPQGGRLIDPRFHNRTCIPLLDNKHLNSLRFQKNHSQFLAPYIGVGLMQLLDENGYNKNLLALLSLAESFGTVRTLMFRNRDSVSITHSTAKASAAFCNHVRKFGVTLLNFVGPTTPGGTPEPFFIVGKAGSKCPAVESGEPALRHGNATKRRFDRHVEGEAYLCSSHPTAGSNTTLILGPKVEIRTNLVEAVFKNMFNCTSIEYNTEGKYFIIDFPSSEAAVMAHHFLHRPFQVTFGLSLDFQHPQQWYTPFHLVRLPQVEA